MTLDDRLHDVRAELARDDVTAPSFGELRGRYVRRRRARYASGAAALAVTAGVVAAVVVPGSSRQATVRPVAPPSVPATATADGLPPAGHTYLAYPDGATLRWKDLVTGATGTIPNPSGKAVDHPSVSADGRTVVWDAGGSGSSAGGEITVYGSRGGGDSIEVIADNGQKPVLSPDSRYTAFADRSDGSLAVFFTHGSHGAIGSNVFLTLPGVSVYSFAGSGDLVYKPADESCAVTRRVLTSSTTRCVVSSAALTAAVGEGWSVTEIGGSGASDDLALGLLGPDEAEQIAVAHPDGTITPVAATKVARGTQVNGAVLIDGGRQIAYAEQHVANEQTTAPPTIELVAVSGGRPRTVAAGGDLGFGIASGS